MPTTPTANLAVPEPFGQAGVRRLLFPALACSSLALCVLSLGMWARSHQVVDRVSTERAGLTWVVRSVYGRVLVVWADDPPAAVHSGGRELSYRTEPMRVVNDAWQDSVLKRIGIEWRNEPLSGWGVSGGWLRVRWPFIAAVSAVLPLWRLVRERRDRRHRAARLKAGLCPWCGYDVSAAEATCPKCGSAVAEALQSGQVS